MRNALSFFLAAIVALGCGGGGGSSPSAATFSLTTSHGPHGTLVADPAPPYAPGTLVTLSATADAQWKVQGWSGTDDDASTLSVNHVTMGGDRTVRVTFTAVTGQTFTLTLGASGGGGSIAADPAGPSYLDGTRVNLTAVPDPGFQLQAWLGSDNDALTTVSNSVVMTSDRTVSATFAALTTPQTCPVDPATGNAVARMISPLDGATLPAGAVTFQWCNASADYFLAIESVPGAHDIFFAFAGGPGAGVTSLTLGPACAASPPLGCIPAHGEQIFVTLYTVKSKAVLAPSPFHYTYTAAGSP